MADPVRLDVDDHVACLTLARPEVLNRFDEEFHDAFAEAVGALAVTGARAAVLAAEGRCFSAGGDTEFMWRLHDDPALRRSRRSIERGLIDALIALPMPIVCALQGSAFGFGATVVLCCDAIVASRGAMLSDPHVAFGLVAGDGGCVVWPQAMGLFPARRYLLTGDRLDAERAFNMGIVSELVDHPEEVVDAARLLAARMAALPPLGVQGTKRALSSLMRRRVDEIFDVAVEYELDTFATEDFVEAVRAFKERRPGQFKGC